MPNSSPRRATLGSRWCPSRHACLRDLGATFASIARQKVNALLILGQPFLFGERDVVARLALEHRLPAMVPFVELAHAGVLLSYGSRVVDDVRRLPYYVDRILKGSSPGELPVEQPTRFYLTINLKTANAMGLIIPPPVLARADEVIQ